MVTTVFGQYVGFWFGTSTAFFFILVFLTCRIMPVGLIKRWDKYFNPLHKIGWYGAIISVILHIALITLAYVFNVWF